SGDPVNDNRIIRLREEKQILTEKQSEVHEIGQPDEGADPTKQILMEKQPKVHETGQPDKGADPTEQILVNPYFPDQIITIG
ncbi:hypothetical protein Tco_0440382, partial [Tanacetum coccineum]